jgi:uncharacterized membrane protein
MWPSTARSELTAAVTAESPVDSGHAPAAGAFKATLMALLALAAFAGYAWLSNWLMVNAAQEAWAVAVLFGPLLLAVAGTAWQGRQMAVLAACGAGVAVLVWVVLRGGVADANRVYVLQHGGIHLALAWAFGSTLRAGSTPLISALAASVHQRFTPAMQAYTRWLTGLWTVYFVAMVGMSALIYALAPWPWWSLYCNVLTPLAAVAFFLVEHVLRYRRHPDFERVSIRLAVQAYRRHDGRTEASGASDATAATATQPEAPRP